MGGEDAKIYTTILKALPAAGPDDTSPPEPLPEWFLNLLYTTEANFGVLLAGARELNDWGLIADLAHYRGNSDRINSLRSPGGDRRQHRHLSRGTRSRPPPPLRCLSSREAPSLPANWETSWETSAERSDRGMRPPVVLKHPGKPEVGLPSKWRVI